MGITVQHKRGTEAQVAAYTGVNGEIVFDTTNNKLVAMDGSLLGGYPFAKVSDIPSVPSFLLINSGVI